ncbi:MAG: response regulator [Bryobacteraceae bacterium]
MSGLTRPIEVLLVEDNPGDIRLTQEALKQGLVANNLSVVPDGIEAMEFLQQRGKYAKSPRPDLILLDLGPPGKDGGEILHEIKSDPALRRIPVMVLTTSDAEQDLVRAYNLHANCYVKKPLDLDEFLGVVRSIEQFWFHVVTLPRD